jgi:hypothetical protein
MPFDVSARPGCVASVVGRHQHFLDGPQAEDDVGAVLTLVRGDRVAISGGRGGWIWIRTPRNPSENPVVAPIAPKVGDRVLEEVAVSD